MQTTGASEMALQEILQNMQGFQSLAANQQQMQQRDMQQTQQREAADYLRKYQQSEASGKPDYTQLQEAVLRSPDLAKNYLNVLGLRDAKSAQQMADDVVTMYSALGNKDQFNQVAARRVESIMQRGGDPKDTLELVQIYNEKGPEAAKQALQVAGAAFANQGLIKPEFVGIGKSEKQAPMQQGQGEMAGYVFDPNTGKFTVDQSARQAYIDAKAKQDSGDSLGLKDMVSLNKEISTITKDATMIHRTAQDLDKLSKIKSGPAAISMVYKFMKSLDPTSVVREGEFATAERAAGVPDTVLNYYNRLVNGERLPDSVIADFVSTSKQLANTAVESAEVEVNDYLNTFGDKFDKGFAERLKARVPKRFEVKSAPSDKQPQQAPQQAIDFLKANPQMADQFKAKYGYLPEGF